MSASYVVQGLSTIIFILSRNIWVVAVSAVIFGIGYGGYVPQYPILTRESFGMKSYGVVYGSISSGLGIGSLIGPPILGGYLLAVTGNYLLTFVLSASFSLVAGATALLIRSPEPTPVPVD
jgi:MFS family permease